MIQRLRRRFIHITMCSVALVLALLLGTINITNFVKMDKNADLLLEALAENNGELPKGPPPAGQDMPPPPMEPGPGNRRFTPETPYETRYFSVDFSQNGQLVMVNTGKIAAVTTQQAVDLARELLDADKTRGYAQHYKYLARETPTGTQYIFLDCNRDLENVRTYLFNSLLVTVVCLVAVFLLVLAMSKRAIRPVVESYEKQKQFITNASHEIKTPLTIIDSCTQVLELEQGENKWTQGIRGQIRRLTGLTQSLVALSRMEESSETLPMEDFDLSEAVLDTLEPFALLAEEKNLRLTLEVQPEVVCHGSEAALRQLCSILADNAVKYALPDSEIKMSLKKKGRRIQLSSENLAQGLTSGDQSFLFDRFYRADASRSSEGYGIGLSMAQSIAAAHSGRMEARSEDGQRLTITVTI